MQAQLEKAQHDQQHIPIPVIPHDTRSELDNYAKALATMENIIHQTQNLPYRHMPTILHDALENVMDPIDDNTIPNQRRLLPPSLQVSAESIQRARARIQQIQANLPETNQMPPPPPTKPRKNKSLIPTSTSSAISTPSTTSRQNIPHHLHHNH